MYIQTINLKGDIMNDKEKELFEAEVLQNINPSLLEKVRLELLNHSDYHVLIVGKRGVGKDELAKVLYKHVPIISGVSEEIKAFNSLDAWLKTKNIATMPLENPADLAQKLQSYGLEKLTNDFNPIIFLYMERKIEKDISKRSITKAGIFFNSNKIEEI